MTPWLASWWRKFIGCNAQPIPLTAGEPYTPPLHIRAPLGNRIQQLRDDALLRRPPGWRWTPSRRAFLIKAARKGAVTFEELRAVHGITKDEWTEWNAEYPET